MINQVHTTKDYSLFKSVKGNRVKNLLHLKRLEESIKSKYLFTVIIVNEKYEIIDGQHRFDVISKLKLPLNYIICRGYSLNEVHLLNQNSKTWNSDDYMNGYCELGVEDYIIYRDFKQKYKFGHNECMALLSGNKHQTGDSIKLFYEGKFKVVTLKEANDTAKKIIELNKVYDGAKRRSFIFAIMTLLKKDEFSYAEFLSKLKKQPSALTDCVNISQYISIIEDIYNYKRRQKVGLRY